MFLSVIHVLTSSHCNLRPHTEGTPAVVKSLCDANADPNLRNAEGAVPLHDAAARGNVEVIGVLLDAGADATIRGVDRAVKDKLPLDLIKDTGPQVTAETASACRMLLMKAVLDAGAKTTTTTVTTVTTTTTGVGNPTEVTSATSTQGTATAGEGADGERGGGKGKGGEGIPTIEPTPDPRARVAVPLHPELHKLWPYPKKLLQTSKRLVLLPEAPSVMVKGGAVRVCRPKVTIEDAIGSHACSLGVIIRATNSILLGCPLPLTVTSVNSTQTR